MFRRIVVANRGEIAVRVIRACRELGIASVAVYGDGEENAAHVRLATDAYRIPPGAGLPYLDISAIVAIARRAQAEAVHPGYGFLAENAEFAEACVAAELVFIGPTASAIRAMGDKVAAREIAITAGIPVVPGSDGPVESAAAAALWAEEHGYPVAVKASGGGGGRGFRVARSPAELPGAFEGSSGEASRFFGNPTVYLEKYLERPRHIEVQVFADGHGNVVSLGERDCSVQRRHQKLIEESPSPAVGDRLRTDLGAAAVQLASAVEYRGAGTVEFLLDSDGSFAFLEMNTRIQVEHTVTELVTGIDLVREQITVAAGRPLSFTADEIVSRGHAIECRINAEDPSRDFAPTPGTLTAYVAPSGPGIRVDGSLAAGAAIHPAYDSLIAKLVVWDRDRPAAIARMERALAEFQVEGVPTTIGFHQAVLDHPVFRRGEAATTFLADHPEVIATIPSTGVAPGLEEASPLVEVREIVVEVDGRRLTVRLAGLPVASPGPPGAGRSTKKPRNGGAAMRQTTDGSAQIDVLSPIQGNVLRVTVASGQVVAKGEVVVVVEAMKMENEIIAHRDGTVGFVGVAMGDPVKVGTRLLTIE